jgi:RimJ/RimL family protein N-acetyltransferase
MQPILKPAKRPEQVTLVGRYVTLVPADPSHAPAIFEATRTDDSLWDYMGDGPYTDLETFSTAWQRKAESPDAQFYTIIEKDPVGYASLMRIDTPNACVEVGNIMYSPTLQRTPAATEVQYLLARYVFEDLGNRRYEWKCNALNAPSRRAALRYGFEFEGIFRQHMIIKNKNRDTAWFAMLDCEWPARKAAFEAWLDPANFDESGRQKSPLARH